MPERIFALYQYSIEENERAEQMFLDAGLLDIVLKPGSLSGLQKVELSGEDAVSRLQIAALAHGIQPPAIRRFLDPTRKELREAQLLYVRVTERHSPRGHPRRGTSYDDSAACAECGSGLRQTSPFRLLKGEIPKRGFTAGVGDDFLFHDSIAEVLTASALDGIRFLPVLDSSGGQIPWRQLIVEHEMPPMSVGTRGLIRGRSALEKPCTRCSRDGHFDTGEDPFIPLYRQTDCTSMHDAAWTVERFGTAAWGMPIHGKRWLAQRRLIVKPSFYGLIEPLKIRGLAWSPVQVM